MALERRISICLRIVIAGLILSGLTAIPLERELDYLLPLFAKGGPREEWLAFVHSGLKETYSKYPFVAYGADWLAFAHVLIAVLFIGAQRDPVKNIWVIEFGLLACALVLPTALFFGHVRGIPLFHRLIDCSFGLGGFVPLFMAWSWTKRLMAERHAEKS